MECSATGGCCATLHLLETQRSRVFNSARDWESLFPLGESQTIRGEQVVGLRMRKFEHTQTRSSKKDKNEYTQTSGLFMFQSPTSVRPRSPPHLTSPQKNHQARPLRRLPFSRVSDFCEKEVAKLSFVGVQSYRGKGPILNGKAVRDLFKLANDPYQAR